MADNDSPTSSGGFWRTLRRPSARFSLLTLLVVGFFGGIIFWGGFNTGMEATNTLEFCISCHEMRDNVYAEYKETIHYTNRTGVRAVCADCHVPKDWTHKMIRKVQASKELYGKVMGTIDTKEKFEAHRHMLATRVWTRMKQTDSLECRNCHHDTAWDEDRQTDRAKARHAKGKAEGLTCIDCHFGIAHKEPEGPGPRELEISKPQAGTPRSGG